MEQEGGVNYTPSEPGNYIATIDGDEYRVRLVRAGRALCADLGDGLLLPVADWRGSSHAEWRREEAEE
jgi:hypothetical protein